MQRSVFPVSLLREYFIEGYRLDGLGNSVLARGCAGEKQHERDFLAGGGFGRGGGWFGGEIVSGFT